MNDPNGLSVQNLHHAYGHKIALSDVGFSVPRGRFCALLGPNGAGKSTLFALLTRLFVAKTGNIFVAGVNLSTSPRKALARMGVVFQQTTLDLDLSVQQNMAYYAALHGISGNVARDKIATALERLGMAERAHEKVKQLNGGHRRRMEIARALLHKPEILLLDEPTVGLDAGSRKAITDYVHSLTTSENLTVLWATHLVDEVMPEDQVVVINKGRVIANDTCSQLTGERSLADVFEEMTGSDT